MSMFDVIYSNPRKKKDASQDGSLQLAASKALLLDDGGKQIASKPMKPEEMAKLGSGDHISMGGWDVEIGEQTATSTLAAAPAAAARPAPPTAPISRPPLTKTVQPGLKRLQGVGLSR